MGELIAFVDAQVAATDPLELAETLTRLAVGPNSTPAIVQLAATACLQAGILPPQGWPL